MLNALISNVPSNAAGAGQGAANKGSVPSGFALLTQPKPQTTEITAETSVVAVDTPPSTALPEVMALLAEMLGSVKSGDVLLPDALQNAELGDVAEQLLDPEAIAQALAALGLTPADLPADLAGLQALLASVVVEQRPDLAGRGVALQADVGVPTQGPSAPPTDKPAQNVAQQQMAPQAKAALAQTPAAPQPAQLQEQSAPQAPLTATEMTKLVEKAPVPQGVVPQGVVPPAAVEKKRPADATLTTQPAALKAVGVSGEPVIAEPGAGNETSEDRSQAFAGIFTKSAGATGQDKPQTIFFDPATLTAQALDAAERPKGEPVSVFSPEMVTATAKAEAAAVAVPKAVPKPFAEALMAQVKSVDVTPGRTTINLMPQGLGNIEIEVIAEKDVTSKVVVRVENPMVLQALRDDRQMLAQAIGVSDSNIFDFQERGTGAESQNKQPQGDAGFDMTGDALGADVPRQHLDVVQDDRIDILT
jgi:hypothetical protein